MTNAIRLALPLLVAALLAGGCGHDDDGALDLSSAITDGGIDASAGPIVCGPPATSDHIKAIQHDGQTFVTWPDVAPGDAGTGFRYDVYRALHPITDANLADAERVAKGVLNNSGKLFGTAFTEAARIDVSPAPGLWDQPAGMTVIAPDAGPLPPWTGLFVHTATEDACAYYAVIATDVAGHPIEGVVPGNNAMTAPVAERVQPMQPIKLYDSKRRGIYWPDTDITGAINLPLRVILHASNAAGGGAGEYGDYYVYYADETMGYVDGMPGVFSVQETHSGPHYLEMTNRDTIVAPDGNGGVETYWFGYQAVPDWAPSTPPRAYPFTEARLVWMIGQVITRYAVDADHVSCLGGSMGAWGATSFCLRHPELFSAVYPDRPRPRQFGLPSLTAMPDGAHAVMADGTTPYLDRMDSVKYVSEHHEDLPFFVWDIGRNDGYGGPWQNHIDLVNAFEATHHGFAFMWNDGDHSGTGDIAAAIQAMYPPEKLARNESYPAFSHSSIDDNLGNGDPTNGDPTGGINLGFDWTAVDDQPHRWSASISNTATVAMTVDVTPRRCQNFHLSPGDTVSWTTSTGGSGTLVADAWGLVTVPKVAIAPGKPTVVTVLH